MHDRGNTSFTEMNTLDACEQKWVFKYVDGIPDVPGPGATLGTLVHAGVEAWWQRKDPIAALASEVHTRLGHVTVPEDIEVLKACADSAEWLLKRYMAYHGEQPPAGWELVASELEFDGIDVPNTNVQLRGRIDAIARIDNQLWVVETKSYRNRARLDYLTVDPQITLYTYAAMEVLGVPWIQGELFDGIYTYRWKPDRPSQAKVIEEAQRVGRSWPTKKAQQEWARAEVAAHPGVDRPLAESFDRVFLDRTPEQITAATKQVRNFGERRSILENLPERALLSLGQQCSWCPYKAQCHEGLLFGTQAPGYGAPEDPEGAVAAALGEEL